MLFKIKKNELANSGDNRDSGEIFVRVKLRRLLCRLSRWNAMALRVRDCQNRSATELAAENGHTAIAEELNRLEARRQDERLFLRPASPIPRRPSQDSGLDLALC